MTHGFHSREEEIESLDKAIKGSRPVIQSIITQVHAAQAEFDNLGPLAEQVSHDFKMESIRQAARAFGSNLDDEGDQAALLGLAMTALSLLMDIRMPPAELPADFANGHWDSLEETLASGIAAFNADVDKNGLEHATRAWYISVARERAMYGNPALMAVMMRRLAFLEMTQDLRQQQ